MDGMWWLALAAVAVLGLVAALVDGAGRIGGRPGRKRRRGEGPGDRGGRGDSPE
ncbi:hypothetical protein ACL02R_11220 [Streptomyces sp. MS19]|uniref:hypothetical protein n=1 Tax=Streptomyces sp. MS19 TaxID=3385972 RepID=UPI0039A07261